MIIEWGLGIRVYMVWGLGFEVSGFEFRISIFGGCTRDSEVVRRDEARPKRVNFSARS